ncbi:hypothetical protein SAMN04487969_102166 [Paenibacillus algorifonticola]|uniref:CN hydrolase domain-containing protein n=1 Tax=Paenibacillus algorifonticola TaxID=684063 RepID=A0A1I1ZYA2_9BACL|nr:hypothetical protein [Paenibacillus algorifonticola]SFE36645.1 hypothetical protein SAMN04487969_102166 [Paenibacillus algorifonticola]
MKLLIMQPKLESGLVQLEEELVKHPEADAILFPEGYLNENVKQACHLAHQFNKLLIGGHRRLNEQPKDRAIIIDGSGRILLDRMKYSDTLCVEASGMKIGHILCDELVLQGVKGEEAQGADLLVHPIGVGMFSEEQFEEWTALARQTAIASSAFLIGTSHADGKYRDSELAIPIAYGFSSQGETLFIAKNDCRSRIVHLGMQEVSVLE